MYLFIHLFIYKHALLYHLYLIPFIPPPNINMRSYTPSPPKAKALPLLLSGLPGVLSPHSMVI